jgi:heme oxygenase
MRPRLRARVEALHARLDQLIEASCFGETLNLRRLLAIHHTTLGTIVPALECAGAAHLFPGWEGRSRLSALEADMAGLGADPPPRIDAEVSFRTEQEVWGALYAIEGSRLGNRVLLQRVMERGDGLERRATRFLAHCPEDGAGWLCLVARLEALNYGGAEFEGIVRGAERVFGAYLMAAERHRSDNLQGHLPCRSS